MSETMKYNFDQIIDRQGTNSMKWEFMDIATPDADDDTLPMWVADMDFACPQPVLDAMHRRIDRQIFGYSSHKTPEYYNAIIGWFQRRFNWTIKADEIYVSLGVHPALNDLIQSLTVEGDGIMIQRPVYSPFTAAIEENKRVVINNALINHNGYYTVDFNDLATKARDPKTTMMILCSPHNPIGRVWTKDELQRMGRICLDNDVTLVSDEVHCDLIRADNRHYVTASLFPDRDEIITCTAAGKTFNVGGLYDANIIIRNAVHKRKWEEQVGFVMLSPLATTAMQAAYNECDEWVDALNQYLDGNIAFMADYIEKHLPKATYWPAEGTYLAWVDFNGYGLSKTGLRDAFIREANVLVDMGYHYGDEGMGFVRINLGCPRSVIQQAMDRIRDVLEG